uniref:Uncharacterized protein n=1 Tax=Heterorhabditis bacteriophora TaxID=37862 RepID=A0A1I7WGR3_HETBA
MYFNWQCIFFFGYATYIDAQEMNGMIKRSIIFILFLYNVLGINLIQLFIFFRIFTNTDPGIHCFHFMRFLFTVFYVKVEALHSTLSWLNTQFIFLTSNYQFSKLLRYLTLPELLSEQSKVSILLFLKSLIYNFSESSTNPISMEELEEPIGSFANTVYFIKELVSYKFTICLDR